MAVEIKIAGRITKNQTYNRKRTQKKNEGQKGEILIKSSAFRIWIPSG